EPYCQFLQAHVAETSSVSSTKVIWERSSCPFEQAPRPGLCSHCQLYLWVEFRQSQQHPVPSRGAAETAEGRGGRHRPETSKDSRQINERVTCSPAWRECRWSFCFRSPTQPSTGPAKCWWFIVLSNQLRMLLLL
ncbi:hypothetical protein XENOCAPTIV_015314, partial [Xenoophorus captivus]